MKYIENIFDEIYGKPKSLSNLINYSTLIEKEYVRLDNNKY